jgi:hypothetical protein
VKIRAFLVAAAMLAASPLYACCISVTPRGINFFTSSNGVGWARWNGRDAFVVESVVHGDVKVGETLPHIERQCEYLQNAKLYFVSRFCNEKECSVWATDETNAKRLLQYLADAHYETHESVLAKTIDWTSGAISAPDFAVWLSTVAVKPGSHDEDAFVVQLVTELDNAANWIADLPKEANVDAEMQALAKLAREFPRGTEAEFDKTVDQSNDDARLWVDYGDDVIAGVKKLLDAAIAKTPKTR